LIHPYLSNLGATALKPLSLQHFQAYLCALHPLSAFSAQQFIDAFMIFYWRLKKDSRKSTVKFIENIPLSTDIA
jgi:hypothetical protein